jgi:reverse gyrase
LKLLAKYKFDSLSYAKNIDFDVQVITSIDDEIIGYKLSQNLSDNFKNHKEIVILDNNVKHNDYFQEKEVQDTIKQYLSERL